MTGEPIISVRGVSKKFCRSLKRSLWYGMKDLGKDLLAWDRRKEGLRPGEFWSLKDVSFELGRGESIGLIGANGAGKTTLLRLISGLILPDKGEITTRGRVQALISLGAGFIPVLSGRENIYINGAILGMSRREIDRKLEEIVAFAEIGEFIDSPVQNYSSGMAARLGFAVAAHVDPDILLVDEVLAVGDIAFRMKCQKFMLQLVERGVCLVVVSHAFTMLQGMCRRLLWIDRGEVKALGEPWEVWNEYKSWMLRPRAEGLSSEQGYGLAGAFLSVKTFDENGVPSPRLPFGRPWSVEVQILGYMPVKGVRLAVYVWHNQTSVVFASMFEEGREFDLERGENVLRVRFGDMPLLPGQRYSFYLCLRDTSAGIYLVDSVIFPEVFEVVGDAFPDADPRTVVKDFAAPIVVPHAWDPPVRLSHYEEKARPAAGED